MRSPAVAIAWEFGRRYRWGFGVLVLYLVAVAIGQPGNRITFTGPESFAVVVIVPLAATFIYFLAIFSYGLSGDLAARHSMYPRRMLTLPMTTSALALWPMLFGTIAMMLLWFVTRFFAVWPTKVDVPVVWPALLAASLLAWTQALTWMPYPLAGMRVVVTVIWLATIDAIVMVALEMKAHEPVMLAILAPHIPLAFVAARYAIGRARRGDTPDWGLGISRQVSSAAQEFTSAARAQEWFEWRRFGRSMPAFVAILLPFELSLLFVFKETPVIIFEVLLFALITPALMATFAAAAVNKGSADGSDAYELSPFVATRPLNSVSLIAARIRVTIRSTLTAWAFVVIAVPIALWWSGTWTVVDEWRRSFVNVMGPSRALGAAFLGLMFFVAATWKQLVQSLYVGLSGRDWMVKASVFASLSIFAVIVPLAHWAFTDKSVFIALWYAVPWLLAILVCMKTLVLMWVALRLHRTGAISDRTLISCVIVWNILVIGLYLILVWIFPQMLIRSYVLAYVAILEVPLTRIAATPLALAWSRHR